MAPPEAPVQPEHPGPAQPQGNNVRVKARPREYRDGEEFTPYINHFERVATANGWNNATKLVQLETVLKGKAQRDFEAFIEENPGIEWTEMLEKLKAELVPSIQKSLDAFSQLRMDGQSPKEFYASLVRLSKLAHGTMNAEARHIIVRAQMLQALPKKLRHDAGKQEYLSDLNKEELLTLLTRIYDAEMKEETDDKSYEPVICKVQSQGYRSTESRVQDLEKENQQLKQDVGEIKDMMKQLLNKEKAGGNRSDNDYFPNRGPRQPNNWGQRRQQYSSSRDITCFKCQNKGHLARECNNPRKCSYCNIEGHSYSYCPQRPKN